MKLADCPFCSSDGGVRVARDERLRVIRAEEADHPATYRVIWHAHVTEWTDLDEPDRAHCMAVVARVERAVRDVLAPHKVNLASLGNMVPHLHWHVIPRFHWDTHFPHPVWGPRQREPDAARLDALRTRLPALDQALAEALAPASTDWPLPPA